jgi:hypothetical protein
MRSERARPREQQQPQRADAAKCFPANESCRAAPGPFLVKDYVDFSFVLDPAH